MYRDPENPPAFLLTPKSTRKQLKKPMPSTMKLSRRENITQDNEDAVSVRANMSVHNLRQRKIKNKEIDLQDE